MATNKVITVTVIPTRTGDTVASYNVYEGVSGTTLLGTMSVAEAAAGKVFAFTDGIVHSVKVQTVWTTAGASTLRSAGVELDLATSVLFEDDFAGSTLNPIPEKWVVTLDTPSSFDITQNDKLIMEAKGTTTQATLSQTLIGQSALAIADIVTVAFDITSATQNEAKWAVGITQDITFEDNLNKIVFQVTSATGEVNVIARLSGVSEVLYSFAIDLTTTKSFKIVFEDGNVKFKYWDGGAWVAVSNTAQTLTGNWYPVIGGSDITGDTCTIDFENYVITNEEYDTLRP